MQYAHNGIFCKWYIVKSTLRPPPIWSGIGENWIREEGELFAEARTGKEALEKLWVISPFRSVADAFSHLARTKLGLASWAKTNVGTVHTLQGKEVNGVIFLPGGNPQKPGSPDWAAQRPNLVNIAVNAPLRRERGIP